ncbi:flagellar hook-length control protein FliK [Aquisediminimonas sediminicola]|uniref:flagellar hook-length control protein FliK n=1 Tax=Alteraquisediminimonas sediminicola TaxID=2676787 RepID=UPI001C8D2EE6|nr:flagellar hook-length control protein FliK [Aquisediminimonas sediminicola]
MMMANSSLLGAGTPAPAPSPNASGLVVGSGAMASITQGTTALQAADEAGAATAMVTAPTPDFAALLALHILGAMPAGTLPGGAAIDGGLETGADAAQDDALPEGTVAESLTEPLAMALLALNGVVVPMPGAAPVMSPLSAISNMPGGAAGVAAPTSAVSEARAATVTAANIMAAMPMHEGGGAPVGGALPNGATALGVQGMSFDTAAAGFLAGGDQPLARVALAAATPPAPSVDSASDAASMHMAAPVAMPLVLAAKSASPRADMAKGPAMPDAPMPFMADIVAPAPNMSPGKNGPLVFGVQEVATSGRSASTAPASGPILSPLVVTASGLAVARPDNAMTSTDFALADTGAAQSPVERQLDLARHDRWVHDLARDIAASASSDGKMSFRLDPPQLGRLAVTLQQVEAGLSVRLDAETAEATQIITHAQPRLMEDLRQQGVRVADASVGTQTGQNQHQSQQHNQGQQQGQNMAQANSGQQDTSRQQGRAFDLNGDQSAPQAEAKSVVPDADAHRRVA